MWQAWANDRETPVVPAYVGLKAVRVPAGDSVIRLEFRGASSTAMTALASAGAICSFSLLAFCAACCVAGFPSSKRFAG
jgi:hypothetical protein